MTIKADKIISRSIQLNHGLYFDINALKLCLKHDNICISKFYQMFSFICNLLWLISEPEPPCHMTLCWSMSVTWGMWGHTSDLSSVKLVPLYPVYLCVLRQVMNHPELSLSTSDKMSNPGMFFRLPPPQFGTRNNTYFLFSCSLLIL